MFNRVTSGATGLQYVDCGDGYSVLSCGFDNIHGAAPEDYRYAIPTNPKTCACYDTYGCTCIAWCKSGTVPGFEIVLSGREQVPRANCPAGTNVIGCHLIPSFVTPERWRHFYPDSNGSCTCYDNFGGVCVATCASNIKEYEIRHQFGYDVVTVNCLNQNTYVLGCGVLPRVSSAGHETWRFVHVGDSRSCQCYDSFGVTCYAICGRF